MGLWMMLSCKDADISLSVSRDVIDILSELLFTETEMLFDLKYQHRAKNSDEITAKTDKKCNLPKWIIAHNTCWPVDMHISIEGNPMYNTI